MARWLDVSHTYIQNLVRKFEADPERMWRIQAAFGPATFEQLYRARDFTRQEKERGCLRRPRRRKLATFQVGSNTAQAVVPTKAEERRRAEEEQGRPLGPRYLLYNLRSGRGAYAGTLWELCGTRTPHSNARCEKE